MNDTLKSSDPDIFQSVIATVPLQCLGMASRTASRAATRVLALCFKPLGLQATQFPILILLRLQPGAHIAALAETLDLDTTTLTRNIKVLKRNGLVIAVGGGGRSGKQLALSPTGEEILFKAIKQWQMAQDAIVEELGSNEVNTLRRSLTLLEDAANRVEHKLRKE